MRKYWNRFNETIAVWSVTGVATMACAYIFGLLALMALPQAIHDSFAGGLHPLPLVTWLSQSFLQLVLLSVIMVGQNIQARSTERKSEEQYNAVMEILADIREGHAERKEMLIDTRELTAGMMRMLAEMQAEHTERHQILLDVHKLCTKAITGRQKSIVSPRTGR
jgi:hypothetical protein